MNKPRTIDIHARAPTPQLEGHEYTYWAHTHHRARDAAPITRGMLDR